MASFATLADLQNRVREGLADSTDTFFSPTEMSAALTEGQWEIYKILHSQNRGYFFNSTPETITLTPSTNYYTLTNDFGWIDEIRPVADANRYIHFYYKSRHDQDFRDMLNFPTDQLYPNQDTFYYDVVGNKTFVIAPKITTTFDVEVFIIQDPAEMVSPGDTPALKPLWVPLQIEYAVRKLKGKEETGEYISHDQLMKFLLENLSKFAGPRGGTNQLTVEEFNPY